MPTAPRLQEVGILEKVTIARLYVGKQRSKKTTVKLKPYRKAMLVRLKKQPKFDA